MTPEQLALFGDHTLTETARMIGLLILERAPIGDWVELTHAELAVFLHDYPSSDTIRRHVGRLERAGWVESRPGGRGHGQMYRVVKSRTHADPSEARTDAGLNKPGTGAEVKAPLRTYPTDTPGTDAELSRVGGDYRGGSRREEEVVLENPTSFHLDPRAREALDQHDDKLAGCRGALVDYLQLRVQPPNQRGFVQSIATWLDQPLAYFRQPDSTAVPAELRTARIAAALNELAAGDSERDMRAPMGDVRNLKTKLDIVIKQAWEAEHESRPRSSGSTRGARGSRQPGRRSPDGSGEQRATGTDGRRSGFVVE